MAGLVDIPQNFTVNVEIDDADIYRIAAAAYLGFAIWYLLRKKGK